jgi:hypothetical protein
MLNITDFSLYSQTLYHEITTLVFSFTKPGDDSGGYFLYLRTQSGDPIEVQFLIDYSHIKEDSDPNNFTTESGSTVYFTYDLPYGTYDGMDLFFSIQGVSISNEYTDLPSSYSSYDLNYLLDYLDGWMLSTSTLLSEVGVHVATTKPQNLWGTYDGYDTNLYWDELSTSSGKNALFTSFSIYRTHTTQISGAIFNSSTNILTHSLFTIDTPVWVIDFIKRSMWFGIVDTEGELVLDSTTIIEDASDSSNEYTISSNNLVCYIEDISSEVLIGTSSGIEYIDSSFSLNNHYIYSVASNSSYNSSEKTKIPIYTLDISLAYPYLRSPGNADNDVLQQTEWKQLKEVLIDQNYYDKTQFAMPYFEHEPYRLIGYLGIANCKLDYWVNGASTPYTTSTGNSGEFVIEYQFKKGTTTVEIQARDKYNIKFSRMSIPYSIRTLNLYSWFYTVGEQYHEVSDAITNVNNNISISEASYSAFSDIYAPLIETYKMANEDQTIFLYLAQEIFKSFEYAAYNESLDIILEAFLSQCENFDHYDIYYNNNNLYDTKQTERSFVVSLTSSTGLERGDYYYGISGYNTSTGEETDTAIIRVDRRWWPIGYEGYTILMWDYMKDTTGYKIYRGYSEDPEDLNFVTSTGYNIFIDIGEIVPDTNITPRLYNYTNLYTPTNLKLYDKRAVTDTFLKLKKKSFLTIILYEIDDTSIEDYNINRMLTLFSKLIPPEIYYRVIIANDSTVLVHEKGVTTTYS